MHVCASQMTRVNTQMKRWSWGEFEFEWTIVGPFKTTGEYTATNCSTIIGTEPGDKNKLGAAAADSAGIDVSGYDFQIFWQPRCSSAGFGGVAWIGAPTGVAASRLPSHLVPPSTITVSTTRVRWEYRAHERWFSHRRHGKTARPRTRTHMWPDEPQTAPKPPSPPARL